MVNGGINMIQDKYVGMKEIPYMESNDIWGNVYFDEKFIPITENVIPGIYDYYLISNYGKVYHKYTGKLLKVYTYCTNNNPETYYCSVSLATIYGFKSVRIHRLVLACFYPELGPITQHFDVNHKDGHGYNNYISYNDPNRGNLEWLSHSDNLKHAYRTGLHGYHSTISEETAKQTIELLALNKYTSKEIVDIVGNGLTTHIVDDIRKKKEWARFSEGYDFYQRPNRLFTEQDIHNFCLFFQSHNPNPYNTINDLCRAALSFNNFEPSKDNVETVRKVYAKKYYKNIVSQYNF